MDGCISNLCVYEVHTWSDNFQHNLSRNVVLEKYFKRDRQTKHVQHLLNSGILLKILLGVKIFPYSS